MVATKCPQSHRSSRSWNQALSPPQMLVLWSWGTRRHVKMCPPPSAPSISTGSRTPHQPRGHQRGVCGELKGVFEQILLHPPVVGCHVTRCQPLQGPSRSHVCPHNGCLSPSWLLSPDSFLPFGSSSSQLVLCPLGCPTGIPPTTPTPGWAPKPRRAGGCLVWILLEGSNTLLSFR